MPATGQTVTELSRIDPRARRATSSMASSSTVKPSAAAISFSRTPIESSPIALKSKRWQRERIVSGTLFGSVVQNTNLTFGGGSSQRLQQCVECFASQHVNFVDDVQFELRSHRSHVDVCSQRANIINPTIGCSVDFQNVDIVSRGNAVTDFTIVAGHTIICVRAV